MDYLLLVVQKDNKKTIDEILKPYYKHLTVNPYVATTKDELISQIRADIEQNKQQGLYADYLQAVQRYEADPSKDNKKALKEFKGKEAQKIIKEMDDKVTWTDERCLEEAMKTFHYPGQFNENGEFISTHNPNSKWDYNRIGGLFENCLPLKNGFKATTAKLREIDFGPQREQYMEACYEWDNNKELQTVSRDSYATFTSSLIPFGFVLDGQWFDRNESNYFKKFNILTNNPKYGDYIVTAVECHI
ncbi:MAG: hypothetical protein ACI35W_07455 [Anaeroplasmataceae bacterium]